MAAANIPGPCDGAAAPWEIYCIKLATREIAANRLIATREGTVEVIYCMWCLRRGDQVVLVETGLSPEAGAERGLASLRDPREALTSIGVDPATVEHVLVTHLHADHFSAWDCYPRARFTLQATDLEFFSGPLARFPTLVRSASDMAGVMGLNYAGRLDVVDGHRHYAPGISLVKVGGHTPGSQLVVVESQRGRIVLCGDALDIYDTLDLMEAKPTAVNRADAIAGLETITTLADGDRTRILPGHDPAVLDGAEQVADGVFRLA